MSGLIWFGETDEVGSVLVELFANEISARVDACSFVGLTGSVRYASYAAASVPVNSKRRPVRSTR